jgi:AcrR family transcriptional regulator
MKPRERILQAADQLFGEIGFDATTTRQIADASGVNKALIHYYFNTKDALFGAVLDMYYERLRLTLVNAFSSPELPRQRFALVLDLYIDFLRENRNFSRMVQREASGGKHLHRVVGHMVPLLGVATNAIHNTFPSSQSGDLAAHQLLISFYGMVVSYFTYAPVLEPLFDADPFSDSEIENRKKHLMRMLDLVLDALEQPASSPGPKKGSAR